MKGYLRSDQRPGKKSAPVCVFFLTSVSDVLYSMTHIVLLCQMSGGGSVMTGRRSVAVCCVLFLLMVLAGAVQSAWSQEVTAAVVGTITDPSAAPIKGADVTVTDTERGTVWATKTNDSGSYTLPRLPVGNYSVKVSAPGFDTAATPPFTLVPNQPPPLDCQIKPDP